MEFKMSYVGIIGLIFAVVSIAAIFLDWTTIDLFGTSGSVTGWEMFNEIKEAPAGYMKYYPVLTLVVAIVAAIVYALEFVGMGNQITRIVGIVLGVLVIVFAFLAYNEVIGMYDIHVGNSDFVSMAYGLYVAFIGGIGVAVAGLLGVLKILPEE